MAWLTATEFSELYVTDSATEIKDAQKEECLNEAIDLLTTLTGSEIVNAVAQASDLSDIKTSRFRRAQGKLAYRALLLIMSARFRSGGVVETERDANGDSTNKYLDPLKVSNIRANLYDEAMSAIQGYLPLPPVSGGEYVSYTPKMTNPGCDDYC